MIVVDTNVIAYLLISGRRTPDAKAALRKDADWAAPLLWRSEFRNVLTLYVRKKFFSLSHALHLVREAEDLMRGNEFAIASGQVLSLAANSKCSAYDCEFVTLAQELAVPLVTTDAEILKQFPESTILLERFVAKP